MWGMGQVETPSRNNTLPSATAARKERATDGRRLGLDDTSALTEADSIDDIKERMSAASPGPWQVLSDDLNYVIVDADGDVVGGAGDAVFIAHAREDVTRLVAELDQARATLADIRSWAETAKEWAKEVNAKGGLASSEGRGQAFFISFGAGRVLAILNGEEDV
jgi:hypothetical protein